MEKEQAYVIVQAMMAMLYRMGINTIKKPSEAICMLRQFISEEDESVVKDTEKCYVEVRDVHRGKASKKGERYAIILHHADGGELEINLKGRNKLVYVLALMTMMRKDAARLSPRMFCAHRDGIVELAKKMKIHTGKKSYEDWVNEFVYKEKGESEYLRNSEGHEGKGYFSFCSDRYSNAITGIRNCIRDVSRNVGELKIFQPHATGGRDSVVSIGISPSQIRMPDSLMGFVEGLLTPLEVESAKNPKTIWMTYYDE